LSLKKRNQYFILISRYIFFAVRQKRGVILKVLSWNVNGIRSALQKEGLPELINSKEFDVLLFRR